MSGEPCRRCGGSGIDPPPNFEARRQRHARRRARLAAETGERAKNAGKQWTGPEMEFALRDDLTIEEIALTLGRSFMAVMVLRAKCRHDPKYQQVVGVSS